MVKKRVGGAHRYKAVQRATAAAASGGGDGAAAAARGTKQQQQRQPPPEDGPKPPSHLQRKITKQVKFYERVLSQGATSVKVRTRV
jgi:hypothetical protein